MPAILPYFQSISGVSLPFVFSSCVREVLITGVEGASACLGLHEKEVTNRAVKRKIGSCFMG